MSQEPETDWEVADIDAMEEDFKKHEEGRNRANKLCPKPGEYVYRFMPPVKGSGGKFVYVAWMHYVFNPADPAIVANPDTKDVKGNPVICPQKQRGAACVVCGVVAKLYRGDEGSRKIAKRLSAREHFFASAVRMDDQTEMKRGPRVYELPTTVYEALVGYLKSKMAGGDFTHPETGTDVVITRVGTGQFDTKYTVSLARRDTPIADKAWLRTLPLLTKAAAEISAPRMQLLLDGVSEAPQDDAPPPSDSDEMALLDSDDTMDAEEAAAYRRRQQAARRL